LSKTSGRAAAHPLSRADARRLALGLALAAAGAVAFSGKAIIAKLSYQHGVDAITVLMLRMLLATPLFIALAWWAGRGKAALTRRDWLGVLGLGFCGYYLASTLDFLGLQYISASLERLILYLNPTLVLLLGIVLLGQRATRRQWLGLGLGYAGVLLVFAQELKLEGQDVLLGTALVFASAVSYAVYLLYSGEEVKRLGALRLTGLATSVAGVLALAQFAVLRPLSDVALIPAPVWSYAVLNATLCTFAPVLAVMLAIERIGATLTAQAGMLGPMSTILLGVWLLGEPFTWPVALGTLLVLAGIWWMAKGRTVVPASAETATIKES
jgi:drug/metabolite transporter (DMT)-like permease